MFGSVDLDRTMKHFRTYSRTYFRTLIPLCSGLVIQLFWVATARSQELRGALSGNSGSLGKGSSGSSPGGAATGSSAQTVTTISSKKGAYLDSKAYMATFTGSVSVVDARFSLTCDKLTAFFVRPSVESAGEVKGESGRSGLDKAEAEGDVIIIQDKVGEKGEVERSLARAQKAVYDSQTGNITLSGWPQVEQKQNVTMAAEESTVIVLNRKGKLEVLGHSKSILRNASMNDGH
jgi:lipopolysaccharide export system protein LptA